MATQVINKATGTAAYTGILTRGVQAAIAALGYEDGKIRFSIDQERLYLDLASSRIEITDFCKTYTEDEITENTDIPSRLYNKVFISSDTHHIFLYDSTTEGFIDLTVGADLTNYINNVTTTGDGNAVTGFTQSGHNLVLQKNSTFLTAHPSITLSANTTSTADNVTAGSSFTAIDSITQDSNGHITQVNTKTITLASTFAYASSAGTAAYASSADNATSATYATSAASASTADNATSAAYATSAGSATSADNATSATYATSAGSASTADNATTASYASSAASASIAALAEALGAAGSGTTANLIPYYGNGGSTTQAASTLAADSFNLDFGDIDSTDYYF